MNDLITVVTPTLGDSAWRLEILFRKLKQFTAVPYRHIVCEDGTHCQHNVNNQVRVCRENGSHIEHFSNPGPYGVSFNLNRAFEEVKTPWVYVIEDGLLPSMDWMERAVEAVERIGTRTFQGHEVGMMGCASLQDWLLRLAGAFAPQLTVMQVYSQQHPKSFYETDWNDGYWCWKRILPSIIEACQSETPDWDGEPLVLKQIATKGFRDLIIDPKTGKPYSPSDQQQAYQKWRLHSHWPSRRTACCGWYPGAFMLVNMDAWRKVGKFRDGCTFFEGHLGIRMGMNGYLSLCLETPPWLHCPSQGFIDAGKNKGPRIHFETDSLFRKDFQGLDHLEAVKLADARIPSAIQLKVNEELAGIELSLGRWK